MKKTLWGLSLCAGLLLGGCSADNEIRTPDSSGQLLTKAAAADQVLLQWNDGQQTIDGFGVAQAGWTDYLYAHRKREEVLNLLFGNDGLRLSILRGEVYPHYSQQPGDRSFYMDEDVDMPLDDPFFDIDFGADGNEAEEAIAQRRGQLWLTKKAKELYQVDKLVFSVWSPPAYMKSNGKVSKGYLQSSYYQDYADYLSDFCDAYRSAGLPVYALSPANEPEYEAEWSSCRWLPGSTTLGKFIVNNLGPTFAEHQPGVKIIFGENAQWNKILNLLMGSKDYVANILTFKPGIVDYPLIAAGHGYVDPITKQVPKIEPFTKAESKGIPVWLTEISDALNSYDTSMSDGLKWAKLFHQYLVDAHVGAIIWWAGALPDNGTNEGLIFTSKDRVTYETTKRYETFGNFSRYIPVGSQRITAEKGSSLPADVLISSFKKGNRYTIVAVNPTDAEVSSELALNGAQPAGVLQRFVTDADRRWEASGETALTSEGTYTLVLPAQSVTTFTGEIQ